MTSTLEIKVVKIHRLPKGNVLRAFVDVSINDSLLIKGLRVVTGKTGLFVSMPQEQTRDKRWYDLVKCLNEETQELVTRKVLTIYYEVFND